MRPTMPPPSFPRPMPFRQATRLRLGRVVLLGLVGAAAVIGSTAWLLTTKGRPVTTPLVDATAWPAWMRQAQTYPVSEPPPTPAPVVDPNAALLAKLTALQMEMERQRQELEALKKRPSGTTSVQQPQQPAAKVTPPKSQQAMLYVAHDLKEGPPKPKAAEYTLAPGATKVPCVIETAINSDVEGYFTAKVATNIYDTATGRHLLVPQGSTILAHDQSASLLYGNERLPTISVTLAFQDGRSVDLGHAPVTDQQGVAGLTGKVDNHSLRLFGAVFIGGALRGGMQALQSTVATAGGVGQVAAGIGATGSQVAQQRLGRALDTRPTITVDSGQLCNVLLIKPLHLPALWE